MAGAVKIRNIVLGDGAPKICVPIVGKDLEEVLEMARVIVPHEPDIVEWRGDFMKTLLDEKAICEALKELRGVLNDIPILFTIRTKQEGGEQQISAADYQRINEAVIASGDADLIDVELFMEEETVKALIAKAHEGNVKVIGSNHDFHKTLEADEIVKRLCRMQEIGIDIAKMAVMPQTAMDVATLLLATAIMKEHHNETPVITMSMSGKGVISRMAGECFGSAMTFGMVGKASAPGQVPVEELRSILNAVHEFG